MATSPNIENYQIPTGSAYFTEVGESARRNLGNVVNFSVSADVSKKEHVRTFGGSRKKDRTDYTQTGAAGKFTLDEITPDNLGFFAQGTAVDAGGGVFTISGLLNVGRRGYLEIEGDNSRGPQLNWAGNVSFNPAGDFFFIRDNDDYNSIACEVAVEKNDDDEGFGVWTWNPGTAA